MAEMATRWRRPTARPMVTVAELLARAAAVPRGSACTPVVSDHTPGVSVDALLRREGRATPAKDRPAHPHARRSAIPDGGSPGRTRRAAVAASTLLAAGSVVGVSLSSNSTGYAELGNTAQPVNAPPVGQSPPAPAGGQNIVPGEQAPVLGATASTGALAAGSGPSADWTAVAFPPTAGSRAADPSVGSAKTSDTTADAAIASGHKTSAADPEPRGDEDTSGSDDDGNGGTPSSGSRARGSVSTPASSTPPDDDVVLAEGGPAEPAPATSEALIPGGAAPDVPAPDSTTPALTAESPARNPAAARGRSTIRTTRTPHPRRTTRPNRARTRWTSPAAAPTPNPARMKGRAAATPSLVRQAPTSRTAPPKPPTAATVQPASPPPERTASERTLTTSATLRAPSQGFTRAKARNREVKRGRSCSGGWRPINQRKVVGGGGGTRRRSVSEVARRRRRSSRRRLSSPRAIAHRWLAANTGRSSQRSQRSSGLIALTRQL